MSNALVTGWDPLEAATAQDANIVTAARKREMQNILRSYVGFYDPFSELIQNAMDAVDAREREGDTFQKHLWITVDLQKNAFSVTNNGIGFRESQFKTFLCPNISFKDGQLTRGKKGVGATYLAYGFNHLVMCTRHPSYTKLAELKEGRLWLDDANNAVERPRVVDSTTPHAPFMELERGSSFSLRFGGANTRPKDLRWVAAQTAEQWKTILLIKTPLGHLTFPLDKAAPILFDLEVIDENGKSTLLRDQPANYIYPHCAIASSVNVDDILAEQQARLAKQQDPSKLPEKFKKLNGVYGFWGAAALLKVFTDEESIKQLITTYQIKAYGYFCYSVKIWDQFNDNAAKLRKGMRILRGGLQLATDHMPQGDLLMIPLTSNIGYQNQSHVIVHFERADPDLGRKGFQPELRETAEQIAVAVVNRLKKWRHLLKADSGATPSIIDEGLLDAWVKKQEQHEAAKPLKIENSHFFVPINQVSITAEPVSEQDVIVLFNQLIAGGVVRGIRLMATSGHEQYDGVFRYYIKEPIQNHVFDKVTNPLGVQQLAHSGEYTSKPYVLEYKHSVDALIQEFENEEKNERDIDLVVAWDIGQEWKKRYSVTSLLDLNNLQHRPFHGVTHVFNDEKTGDRRFYGLILSELVSYLNSVDGVQQAHQAKYVET